ncbi:MAG: thiamine-phosphate synthase family protein [Nitrososphaerales archaeon]|jgi:predicted fused transcriptional regulator/phosphomethylpyrimidine kinase/predicted transcriptional regulator
MVNDFLPNMRGLVSHELHEKGESQRRIALLLGITQARVSYYLGKRRTQFSSELATKFGISQGDIANYSKLLAEDATRSQTDGIFTLYSIWKNLLFTGMICAAHQKESGVQSDCSVCMEIFKPPRENMKFSDQESEDLQVIHEISQAISMIESSVYFPSIMPEVSVNIAMSRNSPKSTRDVAAIPGRINRIHGRAKAFVLPEFGCSNHMSKVLLLANSKDSIFRAVLNIKYDESVGKVLDELGLPRRFTSMSKVPSGISSGKTMTGDDAVLLRLSQVKVAHGEEDSTIALIDRGSDGVEPMTYLIGKKATDLSQIALKIAQSYSAAK